MFDKKSVYYCVLFVLILSLFCRTPAGLCTSLTQLFDEGRYEEITGRFSAQNKRAAYFSYESDTHISSSEILYLLVSSNPWSGELVRPEFAAIVQSLDLKHVVEESGRSFANDFYRFISHEVDDGGVSELVDDRLIKLAYAMLHVNSVCPPANQEKHMGLEYLAELAAGEYPPALYWQGIYRLTREEGLNLTLGFQNLKNAVQAGHEAAENLLGALHEAIHMGDEELLSRQEVSEYNQRFVRSTLEKDMVGGLWRRRMYSRCSSFWEFASITFISVSGILSFIAHSSEDPEWSLAAGLCSATAVLGKTFSMCFNRESMDATDRFNTAARRLGLSKIPPLINGSLDDGHNAVTATKRSSVRPPLRHGSERRPLLMHQTTDRRSTMFEV